MDIKNIIKELDSRLDSKNIPSDFGDYIKLGIIGMITYYGEHYYEQIIDALDDINFYYGIDQILNIPNTDVEQVKQRLYGPESAFTLYNIFINKLNNGIFPDIRISYDICIKDNINMSKILLLEFIVHELNHIICSKCNSLFIDSDGNVGFRNGFYMAYLKKNMQNIGKGRIFNEVINSLMTEDIINTILTLDDEDFEYILKSLKINNNCQYVASGYNVLTTLFRPLFSVSDFKEFCKTSLMNGSILEMGVLFDNIIGPNKYEELLDKLDLFFDIYMSFVKKDSFRSPISLEISNAYIDIKNNYVRPFLERKYNMALTLK